MPLNGKQFGCGHTPKFLQGAGPAKMLVGELPKPAVLRDKLSQLMRREGYIIEEIIEYSNMSEAFDSVLRGTGRKRSRQGRFLLAHREKIIAELTASIADGSFRLGGYHEREIEEYGKKRILQIDRKSVV